MLQTMDRTGQKLTGKMPRQTHTNTFNAYSSKDPKTVGHKSAIHFCIYVSAAALLHGWLPQLFGHGTKTGVHLPASTSSNLLSEVEPVKP